MIECIIFDLDGVLTDTSRYHYLAWKRLADEKGIYFDEKINERLKGVGRRESFEIILERSERVFSEEEIKECLNIKNEYYYDLIKRISSENLYNGVEELLHQIKSKGLKIVLASASKNAQFIMERLGIGHFFDSIIDVNEVIQGKPAPDIFLLAAQKAGALPQNCLVIEDSIAGLTAARRANMNCYGIGGSDLIGLCDKVFKETKDINLNSIYEAERAC